jgi:hypothetical protein
MEVRGEEMHFPSERKKEWEARGMCDRAHRKRRIFGLAPWRCSPPQMPLEGSRAWCPARWWASPSCHRPDTLGSLEQMASLPHPARPQPLECISCRFPRDRVCWLHLSRQPLPQPPQEAPVFVFPLPPEKDTGLTHHQVIQTWVQSHICPFVAAGPGSIAFTCLEFSLLIYKVR